MQRFLFRRFGRQDTTQRRAATAVVVAVMIPVLVGFAAITIDVGATYNTRTDLQRAADAAALAGASAYVSDEMIKLRQYGDTGQLSYVVGTASSRVDEFSAVNPSFGTSTTKVESGDFAAGWIDLNSGTSPIQTGALPTTFNAIEVAVRRNEDVLNGPIEFFFAAIFGQSTGETSATATAVFDDRVGGFDTGAGDGGFLPFTIDEDIFELELLTGADDYGYDPGSETVTGGSDGIKEIRLYPWDLAPGNFGLLNVGTPNQSTPALQNHIENGIPPEDWTAEIGTDKLSFIDEFGDPITHDITGNAGMKSALESSIELRKGDVVGFLLHNQVEEGGSNSVYTVTQLRFGRVMEVNLNGNNKGLWLQPVSYNGGGVIIDPNAPSSGGLLGRIVLAR